MIEELSFDDEVDEDLYVFSGSDFLTSHYDKADLDWAEVASRTAIDERRGLVITQAVVIEDEIDEFILYLADPPNAKQYRAKPMGTWNAGRKRKHLERLLKSAGLFDSYAAPLLEECRRVGERRNRLAHGTIEPRLINVAKPGQVVIPIDELDQASLAIEWILTDRRTGRTERVSMARLRGEPDLRGAGLPGRHRPRLPGRVTPVDHTCPRASHRATATKYQHGTYIVGVICS
jgi:hypothetical protein